MSDYDVQGNYGYGHGWETVTTHETKAEAIEMRDCYRVNDPDHPYRVKRSTD